MALKAKWRDFLGHLSSYVSVNAMLAGINAFTMPFEMWSNPASWWVVWPMMGWGVGVAIHFFNTVLEDEEDEASDAAAARASREAKADDTPQADRNVPQHSHTPQAAPPATNSRLQQHLAKAQAYQQQIAQIAEKVGTPTSQRRLAELAEQVDSWVEAITALSSSVDLYQQNELIHSDLSTVPSAIKELEARVEQEQNPSLKAELQRTLDNRRNQLSSLEQLNDSMTRAEIKIESTLSALGTIYSQLLTSQSTDHVADYSRLSADVDEEVKVLQDQLEALEEIKMSQSY